MKLKKVNSGDKDLLLKIKELYEGSFPVEERRDFGLLEKLLVTHPQFFIYSIEENDLLAGFISGWLLDGFTYVEHFAIDPATRGKRYGTRSLQFFMKNVPHPVVLEVETPENEQSKKRIVFYERLGYKLLPLPYMQPPYRESEDFLPMCLMTYGINHPEESFDFFVDEIYTHVYNQKR